MELRLVNKSILISLIGFGIFIVSPVPFIKNFGVVLGQETGKSSDGYRMEWAGESGYCNCFFVTMCRVPIRTIELRSDRELPNLETLAASRKDTAAWLKTQNFNYSSLNCKKVIEILLNSAGLEPKLGGYQIGSISAVDLVGSNGPEVKRKFNLKFSELNGVWTLQVELEGL